MVSMMGAVKCGEHNKGEKEKEKEKKKRKRKKTIAR